jgi:arginine deiminase
MKLWHWGSVHETGLDTLKTAIDKDIVLAYPNYSQEFEVYTDTSKFQPGAVITQKNRPLAFFSRQLNKAQQ